MQETIPTIFILAKFKSDMRLITLSLLIQLFLVDKLHVSAMNFQTPEDMPNTRKDVHEENVVSIRVTSMLGHNVNI